MSNGEEGFEARADRIADQERAIQDRIDAKEEREAKCKQHYNECAYDNTTIYVLLEPPD